MGELKVLRLFHTLGARGVAQLLARTETSVRSKANEMNISLVVTDEDILVDDQVRDLLRRVTQSQYLSLCPMCAKRWATMRDTGICRPCHLDRLIAVNEEQLAVENRQRTLAAIRKAKQRGQEWSDEA